MSSPLTDLGGTIRVAQGGGRMFNSNAYIIHRPDSIRVNWDILRLDRTNCSAKERFKFFESFEPALSEIEEEKIRLRKGIV